MNQAFFTLLEERLTGLVADLRYLHKPSGEQRAPQIIGTMLERPSGPVEEGDEFPFVRWAVTKGAFARRPEPFSVAISAGIYTDGTISDGNADIMELSMALGEIVNNKAFPPYRLLTPCGFVIGNPEEGYEGIQPHPYYYMAMRLDFLM